MLDINRSENIWKPPQIEEAKLAVSVSMDVSARQSDEYLYIFQVNPYIDSLYIHYDDQRAPIEIRRFTFHEGYTWELNEELFFHEYCIKSKRCAYSRVQIDNVYDSMKKKHPEWHLDRYLTNGLYLLDHIYHCFKQGTAKEMLYRAGLYELAANIDEVDEIDLLSTCPSELYDGIPMKVLRSINCVYGAKLLNHHRMRLFIKELDVRFPFIFNERLNDDQCRYIATLMNGDLTVNEAGNLLELRCSNTSGMWIMSMFDNFITQKQVIQGKGVLIKIYGPREPIYENDTDNMFENSSLKEPIIFEVHEGRLKHIYCKCDNFCTQDQRKWIKSYCEQHGIEYEF